MVQEGSSEGVTFKPCLQEVKDTALGKMVNMNLSRKNSIRKGPGAGSNLALCEAAEPTDAGREKWAGAQELGFYSRWRFLAGASHGLMF